MGKVTRFKPRVGNVKLSLITWGFTVINPLFFLVVTTPLQHNSLVFVVVFFNCDFLTEDSRKLVFNYYVLVLTPDSRKREIKRGDFDSQICVLNDEDDEVGYKS